MIDLADLRLHDLDGQGALGERWIPAAGIPMYIGLVPRHIQSSSRELASIHSGLMRGSLAELAKHLGTRVNDWLDEQHGRIVHAMHSSPAAMTNYGPHGHCCGCVMGSTAYPSAVTDLWRWTRSTELIASFLEPALRSPAAWADNFSRDQSGL